MQVLEPRPPSSPIDDSVVTALARANTIVDVAARARAIARQRLSCQGVTFVIRENEQCFYADEDSIAPLWAGQRFPMSACISGWAMLHNLPAIVDDIEADDRIPLAAYRPTFVRSLIMVPVPGACGAAGAMGAYWARKSAPTTRNVNWFAALAMVTGARLRAIGLADAAWAPTFAALS